MSIRVRQCKNRKRGDDSGERITRRNRKGAPSRRRMGWDGME